MTATAKDSSGNTVAVTTAVGGEVSSVDLTQSPPLLNINGQTYTISQVESIVAPATGLPAPRPLAARVAPAARAAAATDRDRPIRPANPPNDRPNRRLRVPEMAPGRRRRGIFKEIRIERLGLGKF